MTIISRSALITDPSSTALDPITQLFAVTPDRSRYVACHNFSTAQAYSTGRLPNKVPEVVGNYAADAFVAPSGQYYVVIKAGVQRVRMDVANASTALHYSRNGVSSEVALDAYRNQ